MIKKALSLILSILLVTSFACRDVSAGIDRDALFDFVASYDPTAGHLLRRSLELGYDPLGWIEEGNILGSIDTAVHESCHVACYDNNGKQFFYEEDGKRTTVYHTDVYYSRQMADSIPEDLRTSRWNVYIGGDSDPLLGSNQFGAYGLLDEMNAYYRGMHVEVSLYEYYKTNAGTSDDIEPFLSSVRNGSKAYYEFKYFILQYLYFASVEHPDICSGIIGNKSFAHAFLTLDELYSSQVMRGSVMAAELSERFGTPAYRDDDISKLLNEISSPRYELIMEALRDSLVQVSPPPSPSPSPSPSLSPTPSPSPSPAPSVTADPLKAFTDRLYEDVLGRDADPSGSDFWTFELRALRKSGAAVAREFLGSDEFTRRDQSDDEFLSVLYRTFFDREPDDQGLSFWKTQLSQGTSRDAVIDSFCNSLEWANICAAYGIISGTSTEATVKISPSERTFAFVERLYTTALKRQSDPSGMAFWTDLLSNFRSSGEDAAISFFLSDEFASFSLSDEEFVTRLYRTFMDRDPEQGGFDFWVSSLRDGITREEAILGFSRSEEFVRKCVEAKILPYSSFV